MTPPRLLITIMVSTHPASCNNDVFRVRWGVLLDGGIWQLREVKARKAANKAAKGNAQAMKAKPTASKQKSGNAM